MTFCRRGQGGKASAPKEKERKGKKEDEHASFSGQKLLGFGRGGLLFSDGRIGFFRQKKGEKEHG